MADGSNPHRAALLVIDMQNDFCVPGAILCVTGAMRCLPKVVEAVEEARRLAVPVIWVLREHHPSGHDVERYRQSLYAATGGGGGGSGGATVKGTTGAALVDGLDPMPHEHVVSKKRFSGFMWTHLDSLLRRLGVERIAIAGVQTPNCIRATAFDAVALDYRGVSVLRDATASATDEVQQANLLDLRNVGVGTPTVAEWAAALERQQ